MTTYYETTIEVKNIPEGEEDKVRDAIADLKMAGFKVDEGIYYEQGDKE